MAAVGDNNYVRYIYRGEEGERIPDDVTHVTVDSRTTVVRARAFSHHQHIVEVICHDKVEKIEQEAFFNCPSLRQVIMRGVKIAERWAFYNCEALTDVECGKLEIIEDSAFYYCKSLRSINLSSVRIVEKAAFSYCEALTNVNFDNKLERFDEWAFKKCRSLERITIPLKDGMITADNIFMECDNLKRTDLVEGALLHETISALQLEEWRKDVNEEIDSINQLLPNAYGGGWDDDIEDYDVGEKASAIQRWIRSIILKIMHYQVQHQRILDEAGSTLQHALPRDIVMNNVISLLKLPPLSFEEDDESEEDEDYDSNDESEEEEDDSDDDEEMGSV